MVAAVYEFKMDTLRDGTFAGNADNLTSRLIGTANWNEGMSDADQSFAAPAQLTVTLDNSDGAFNPDTLGSEVLTNGDFATWSSGDPSSWTVIGESASDPEVSQVGASALHGGSGTGAANLYTTNVQLSISQAVLTLNTTYRVVLEISASAVGAGGVAVYNGSTQVSPIYHSAGTYTIYFNASSTTFKIQTAEATVNMTINTVSVKAVSLYGQLLSEGMLGYLKATSGANQTQFYGYLKSVSVLPGSINRRVAVLTFSDYTLDLLDSEYIPPLYTNTTADIPIKALFDSGTLMLPYPSSFWLLGIQGSSELDYTTTIFNCSFTSDGSIDDGKTALAYVGDNSIDGVEGVSAQSFLRDLVDSEIYGRFFYSGNDLGYKFHNRHRDALNSFVAFTVTESDYEPELSAFIRLPVLNKSTVSYQPRKVELSSVVLWEADNLPFELEPGNTQITVRYRDVANPAIRIGALSLTELAYTTDYIATDEYGNIAESSYFKVTANRGANSAVLTLFNQYPFTLNVTHLQLRGFPIKTYDQRTATSVNVNSQFAYRFAPEEASYNLIDNQNFAQSIADYKVYRNADPVDCFQSIGWYANKTVSRMGNALSVRVGDRITISDSWMSHSADYIVVGLRHSITWGGEHTHQITLTLKPRVREDFWILEVSLLDTGTRIGL